MTTTLRIDDQLKKDCETVFKDIGLNMTTAITLFLRQVVKQQRIPFALTSERIPAATIAPVPSIRSRGQLAKQYFNEMRSGVEDEMSLEEINAEIAAARAERHSQNKTVQ